MGRRFVGALGDPSPNRAPKQDLMKASSYLLVEVYFVPLSTVHKRCKSSSRLAIDAKEVFE